MWRREKSRKTMMWVGEVEKLYNVEGEVEKLYNVGENVEKYQVISRIFQL